MIAIIGILVSLLLPSVQQAREAGRRVSCVNNVRQLGVALHNYESTHKRLPAAGSYAPLDQALWHNWYWRVDLTSGTNYSWIVSLLPFMEEQSLYDQFDLKVKVTDNPTHPQAHQPASLLCPSGEALGRIFEQRDESSGARVPFGKGNYAAFSNVFHVDSWFFTGAMRLYGQDMRQILDGKSATLVFSEIRTRDQMEDQRGAWALPWSGTSLLSFDFHPTQEVQKEADKDTGKSEDYEPNPRSLGLTQYPNGPNPDVLYECPDQVGEQFDGMPCTAEWLGYISAAPRSFHPDGVNAVFLDGHVGYLEDGIDEYVMLHMVNPIDGE